MAMFRKKPTIHTPFEAVRWTGTNDDEVERLCHPGYELKYTEFDKILHVTTLEFGRVRVEKGDWIIKTKKLHLSTCDHESFIQMYDSAELASGGLVSGGAVSIHEEHGHETIIPRSILETKIPERQ